MVLSKKQINAVKNSNKRINIWEGAVRSGKSFSCLLAFIDHIIHGPPGDMMIVGKSQDSIKRNIVSELYNFLGSDVKYYSGKREVKLYSRTIHVVGASDERAENKIRGSTLAGVLVDEITIIPESFYTMLLSRLSIPGARLYGTTNPDNPFHWFKRKFLDRASEMDMVVHKFYLDDNPSLTEQYKNSLKQEYTGLWYNRYIGGEWCLAEGVVYDQFDDQMHTLDFVPAVAPDYYIIGVDYGTTNPTAFVLIGVKPSHFPNIWVEKEYYYNPAKTLRQKTDAEFADDFVEFISDLRTYVKTIYIDPAAASFKAQLFRHGVNNIVDAENEVLDGIRTVSNKLSMGQLKIVKSCRNIIEEFSSYVWNQKARERGIDQVEKKNDHALDALRYAIYTAFKDQQSLDDAESKAEILRLNYKYGFR